MHNLDKTMEGFTKAIPGILVISTIILVIIGTPFAFVTASIAAIMYYGKYVNGEAVVSTTDKLVDTGFEVAKDYASTGLSFINTIKYAVIVTTGTLVLSAIVGIGYLITK